MNRSGWIRVLVALALSACSESGEKAAGVVQAATKSAAEVGQQLAEKAAELAQMAPEAARAKAQELLDLGARELQEAKDSEAVRRIAEEVEAFLERLAELGQEIAARIDLTAIKQSIQELIERFRNDPRVVKALESLREKLQALGS